jgi:hypothetical protein
MLTAAVRLGTYDTMPCLATHLDRHNGGARRNANHALYVVLGSNGASAVRAVAVPVVSWHYLASESYEAGTSRHFEVWVLEGHAGVQHCHGDVRCWGGGGGANCAYTAHAWRGCLAAAGDEWHCVMVHTGIAV